jgi:Ca2+-binding EF-hand superfamily protein
LKKVAESLSSGHTNEEDVRVAFRFFDRDDSGYITRDELKSVLLRFTDGKITEEDIDQIMEVGGPKIDSDDEDKLLEEKKKGPKETVIYEDVFLSMFR